MRNGSRGLTNGIRGLAVTGIAVLGLLAIVGSGGGSLGFPPCDASWCNTEPPPPQPTVVVDPPYVTALVGTAVTLTAVAANMSGSVSYQWRRSSDGGATFVDIVGATGSSHTLAGVNLADDGAIFRVTAHASNSMLFPVADSRLTVSATPGLVFEDGEFLPGSWVASPVDDPPQTVPVHSEERIATGGNPGAFRKMVFLVPQGTGSARVFYLSQSAAYEPKSQGGIRVIDYAEDCIALQNSELMSIDSLLAIEQSGRRFVMNAAGHCILTRWSPVANRSSLGAQDFRQFDGPACGAGESCPDFSANAAALRFGYWRIAWAAPGETVAHGIDNWKVTVWRR